MTNFDISFMMLELCPIQHYVVKFVSDLCQVRGFLRVLRFPPTNKADRHDKAEILLKVALSTITLTQIYAHVYFS